MRRLSFAIIAGWIVALVSGCGSSNPPQLNLGSNPCPAGVGGLPSNCCTSGVPITTNVPQGCPTPALGGAMISALAGGAASAGSSQQALMNADNMLGKGGASPIGGQAPQYSAATAAGGIGGVPSTQAGAGAGMMSAAQNTNGMSAGMGGGGMGNSAFSSNGMTTSPSTNDDAISRQPATETANGTYGGGGGAANSADTSHSGNWFSEDTLGNVGAGAEAGRLSFGARDSESVAVMVTPDAEDYFSRTKLDESLFKVVERKYREKATRWVLESLAVPGNKALK